MRSEDYEQGFEDGRKDMGIELDGRYILVPRIRRCPYCHADPQVIQERNGHIEIWCVYCDVSHSRPNLIDTIIKWNEWVDITPQEWNEVMEEHE